MNLPYLTDDEVAGLCTPLQQAHAQIKYLQGLGLAVTRKPNGRPLLMRSELERVLGGGRMIPANEGGTRTASQEPNMGALLQVIQGGRRGKTAQGR